MKSKFRLLPVLAAAAIAAGLISAPKVKTTAASSMLHVKGNKVYDASDKEVRLVGVNIASLEWTNYGEHIEESVKAAYDDWDANLIRIPTAQDRWFGYMGQKDGGEEYRGRIDYIVKEAEARGKYVLLDLHWSDMNEWGKNLAQHSMPDDNSKIFWEAVAEKYKNHPSVLFDIYNEPKDVTWDVWLNGGDITEKMADGTYKTYHSPGMQGLVNAIRAIGAKNIITAGGLDWGYTLKGIADGHELKDPNGNGIIYSTHIYPWKYDWDGNVSIIKDKYPILVGECGHPGPGEEKKYGKASVWAPKILDWIDSNGYNWTAWDMHPSAGPSLITGWSYTPTDYWGKYVKKRLLSYVGRTDPSLEDTPEPTVVPAKDKAKPESKSKVEDAKNSGSGNNTVLIGSLVLLAAAGAAGVIVIRNKKKKSQ